MPTLMRNAKSKKRGAKHEKNGAKYPAIHFSYFTFWAHSHIFRNKCMAMQKAKKEARNAKKEMRNANKVAQNTPLYTFRISHFALILTYFAISV